MPAPAELALVFLHVSARLCKSWRGNTETPHSVFVFTAGLAAPTRLAAALFQGRDAEVNMSTEQREAEGRVYMHNMEKA